jgi:hypothetical protein
MTNITGPIIVEEIETVPFGIVQLRSLPDVPAWLTLLVWDDPGYPPTSTDLDRDAARRLRDALDRWVREGSEE